ncbi:MFS general substrate transporter [Lophiostoma macrostomum CBS 122681]|uniref:MFS general substrate transporter n=1 Tax=Lophiostoma macrostomum CBS 122681 TaxID=1314788 RepID=A0A6A6TQ72_9PLEO|nr:MFS general substrate transporter [Lophiostoma macrostomum CBS 122681]
MSSTQIIELQSIETSDDFVEHPQSDSIEPVEANNSSSLPPTDRGKDAWLFLFACFMLEALIWGFPSSYGVFQAYYSSHEPFAGSGQIAVVGACAMGIMYMNIIPCFALLKCFPKLRLWATPVGLVVVCISLGLGSLSTKVSHLILTQGVLYAIGGGFAWTPILFMIEEWWVRRRGFAYGVTMAGLGLSGAILPLVLEWLLNNYGFPTTLRVCALSFVALNMPVLFFFKPRIPFSQTSQNRSFDLAFVRSSNFLILQSGNVVSSVGYFLPTIYLPTFARSLGASNLESIVTIVLLNAAAFIGSLCMGAAVDRYDVTACILVSAAGSAFGVFLLWGLCTSLPLLYIFCLVYGAFAGCASSFWSGIMKETKERKRGADMGMIFAFLSAGKGVGNLCSGPLSEVLLRAGTWKAGLAYGSQYGALISFTGVTAVIGGWAFLARRIGWM